VKKKLKKLLGPKNIFLELEAVTKTGIIEEMIKRLADNGLLKDRKGALEAVLEREEKMSTGMNNGVAIPHGKTDCVPQLVAAVGLKRDGVDFVSTDGKPATIFIMTISPASRSGPHIQFLAEVSKILRDAASRQKLLEAKHPEEILDVFS
jgi:PTS system nitrogen regulatory IIA component